MQASYSEATAEAAKQAADLDSPPGYFETNVAPTLPKFLKKAAGYDTEEAKLRAQNNARKFAEEGEALFQQAKYTEAIDKFRTAAKLWPDSPVAEDSLFRVGECYFFSDNYPDAHDAYQEVMTKYENSRYLDHIVQREFKMAQYWQALGRTPAGQSYINFTDKTQPWFNTPGNALDAYDAIRLHDPAGDLADDAIMATATTHFENGRFEEADYHFGLLRSEYPQSEHQAKAHMLGIRAKLENYQGPHYDSKPLDEAEELTGQALVQFPTELADERERLLQTRAAARAQQAERDWSIGEYYAKTEHYGAARYHWQKLRADFPDTRFAEMAAERLAQTKDLPENPPQRLPWLIKLFPENKRRR
ncbi:MAG: outer membrane protein assembly factor BamD [Planctomycetes bacterium]|nr:outer membrane protein assembly factor BamD [Planctomycetota bacterium]